MQKLSIILILISFINFVYPDAYYTIRADGNGNFLNPQACEDANSNDFLTRGAVDCAITQDGDYLGQLTVSGQTNTSSINYLKFTGTGYKTTSLDRTGGQFITIVTATPYTRYCCLTIKGSYPSGTPYIVHNNSTNIMYDRCVIRATANHVNYVMMDFASSASAIIQNSAIINTISANGISAVSGTTVNIYNSVIFTNLTLTTSTMTVKNSVLHKRTGSNGLTLTQTNTWCVDGNNVTCTNGNTNFAGSGLQSDSIHITTTSPLYKAGIDLSSSGVLTDIDKRQWTLPYSIGADDPTPTRVCRQILYRMGVAPKCR